MAGEERKKKDPYAPPDGGWGWVVMIASFICNLVLDGIAYTFGIFLTPLMEHFGVQKGPMSMVGSVLAGTIQLVGPFVAVLVNKFGTRIVCIAGAIISATGFFASTFATSVPVLMLFYSIVAGTGLGLMYVPAVVAVGYYFEKKRAFATGISVCGSGAGTFILAPLASLLLSYYGWEGATRIFAALCLQCAVCGAVMRPLPRRKEKEEDEELEKAEEEPTPCFKSVVSSVFDKRLLTNVPFLLLMLANLFSTMGLYIPYMYLPTQAESKGIPAVDASFLISVVGICNTLGRILSGILTDLPCVDPMVVTTLALTFGGICPLLMAFCTEYWSFLIVSVMFGSFLSAWVAVTSPVLVEMLGLDLLTSAFGTLTFVRGCAALLGPPLAGFIVDGTGDLDIAFYISAGLLVVSAVVCLGAYLAIKRK
jgi:MCP family monocarboxylic acid transporter-like MFS transporter 12